MCSEHVSVDMNAQRMQRIRVPSHPGETLCDPETFPALTLALCLCTGPYQRLVKASCLMHEHPASVVAHQRACQQQSPCFNVLQTVGFRLSSHRLHPRIPLDLHTGTSTTLSMDCSWGSTMVCKITWTMGNSLCVTRLVCSPSVKTKLNTTIEVRQGQPPPPKGGENSHHHHHSREQGPPRTTRGQRPPPPPPTKRARARWLWHLFKTSLGDRG